jgi:hypothetical protein
MNQAANRPILTLLFHEQPMSGIHPARTDRPSIRAPPRINSRRTLDKINRTGNANPGPTAMEQLHAFERNQASQSMTFIAFGPA